MDRSVVPNWSQNMGVNPKDLQLNHVIRPGLPYSPLSSYDDDMPHSLRSSSNFGNPHTDLLGLAGPNMGVRGEDVDVSFSSQGKLDEGCFPFNEASVPSNGYSLQRPEGVHAYEDTAHREFQTTTSDTWSQRSFDVFPGRGMQSLTESSMAILPQDIMQHQMNMDSSFSSMSSFPNPITSSSPKRSSKRPTPQTATARNRKLQIRRSPQRGSAFNTEKRSVKSTATPSQSLDAASSSTSPQFDMTKTSTIAPQEALALFEASIRPLSTSTQLELADLICQMKKLVLLDQQKCGGGSQSGSSCIMATSTASSTQDSVSNSEMIDSESLTDHTSVSSTPRQLVKDTEDTEDSMSVDNMETSAKHEPCNRCDVKPLYSCTWKNCGYGTHSFADYKRHEGGDKHWPQGRYMCLQCIDHTTPTLSTGEPICKFCLDPLFLLGGNMRGHYVQCEDARKVVTTFSRKDHLIKHLRKDHNIVDTSTTIDFWKYSIDSKWPRQCGFCGITFRSWDERMIHLKEHFDKGADISIWKLPFFPKSKDVRPSGPNLPKVDDDDDDDENGSPHGGNGGSWSKASRQQNFQTAGGPQHSRTTSYTRHRRSEITDEAPQTFAQHQAVDSINAGRPSLTLERYLNDTEEPMATRLTVRKSDVPNPPKSASIKDQPGVLKDSYTLLLPKMSEEVKALPERTNGPRRIFINNFSAAGGNTGLLLEDIPPLKGTVSKSPCQQQKHNRIFCNWCSTHPDGFRGEHVLRRHMDIEHKLKITPKAVSQLPSDQPSPQHSILIPSDNASSSLAEQDCVYYELPAPEAVIASLEDNSQMVAELDSTPCLQPNKEDCLHELPSFTPIEIMAENPVEDEETEPITNSTSAWLSPRCMYHEVTPNFLESPDWLSTPSKIGRASSQLVPCSPMGRPYSNDGFPIPDVTSYPYSGSSTRPISYPPAVNISILSRMTKGMKSDVVSRVFQPDEMKRRRRRESHNMVERRRRDNTNERISSLRKLVPEHRLEDEKVRKHLLVFSSSPSSGGLDSHKSVTSDGPEKCPIQSCDYHIKGFARKYDKNRHTLTHYKGNLFCGFCPSSVSPAEKSFNHADVFKRHLASVHVVEQISLTSSSTKKLAGDVGKKLIKYASDTTGRCSTCSGFFSTAQDFYNHLDKCTLQLVRQEALAKALKSHQAKTFDPSESWQKQTLTPLLDTSSKVNSVSSLWTTFSHPMQLPKEKKNVEVSNWRAFGQVTPRSQHSHRVRQHASSMNTGFQRTNPASKESAVPATIQQKHCSSNTAYPIPISPEKQARARQLYRDYLSTGATHPSPSKSPSPVATTSERKTARAGKMRKLLPQSKAKAALIRYIGPCSKRRDRRVLCPLEHHDIVSLTLEHESPHHLHALDQSLRFSATLEDVIDAHNRRVALTLGAVDHGICLDMMDNRGRGMLGEPTGYSLAAGRHPEPGASRHHSGIFVLPDGSQQNNFTGCTEAFQTDPMQRLSLVTAFEALEIAGYVPNQTPSTKLDRIGTFYGQTSDDWREINAAQDVDTYFITDSVRDTKESRKESITIVGMACRLPGTSPPPEELWELLLSGTESTGSSTFDRGNPDTYYVPSPLPRQSRSEVKFGRFFQRTIESDLGFFNINARDGSSMDPQCRLLLECAYEALENAGLSNFGTPIGKTFTLSSDLFDTIGNVKSKIHFNIDTASSSSCFALHAACNLWNLKSTSSMARIFLSSHGMDKAVHETLCNNYDGQTQRLYRHHVQPVPFLHHPFGYSEISISNRSESEVQKNQSSTLSLGNLGKGTKGADNKQSFAVKHPAHHSNRLPPGNDPKYLELVLKDLSIDELLGHWSSSDERSDDGEADSSPLVCVLTKLLQWSI